MYPDKILQAHVSQTEISRVKILAPWAKAAQNGGENGLRYAVFCNWYNELAFLCNGTNLQIPIYQWCQSSLNRSWHDNSTIT